MKGFIIRAKDNQIIRFHFYPEAAPLTVAAFGGLLPFSRIFFHAKISGQEIWIDNAPELNVIQENASVFAMPGEIVIGPKDPVRNKIAGCMGIFYGEGKLLDCGNIFGKVIEEDLPLLQRLGDNIWREGVQELHFEKI
jgi:Protein of unknown function (DUF3830)